MVREAEEVMEKTCGYSGCHATATEEIWWPPSSPYCGAVEVYWCKVHAFTNAAVLQLADRVNPKQPCSNCGARLLRTQDHSCSISLWDKLVAAICGR